MIWFVFFTGSVVLCTVIAVARRMEWWVGALLGLLGCVGLVIVCVMKTEGGGHGMAPPPPGARWEKDPTGRHELRLWDGRQWTSNVSDSGTSGWDPLT